MNFFIEFTLIPSILVILITILEISILKAIFKTKKARDFFSNLFILLN